MNEPKESGVDESVVKTCEACKESVDSKSKYVLKADAEKLVWTCPTCCETVCTSIAQNTVKKEVKQLR